MTAPGIDPCSLVPLYVEPHFGETRLSQATAFLWLRRDLGLVLLTNWHVVSGRNHETDECLSKMGGIPDRLLLYMPYLDRAKPPLLIEMLVVDDDGEPLWIEHERHGRAVDVVALPVSLPPPDVVATMPMNAIRTVALKQRVGFPLFILGYPFGRQGLGMPVWKQGSFASEPYFTGHEAQRFLIVDTASRPGMSGSPVIQRVHGEVELEEGHGRVVSGDGACRFVGIYSGRFHTNDAGDAQLGRVWPAALVDEIANSPGFAVRR